MYCSHCVLPSRLRSKHHTRTRSCEGSSSDHSAVLQNRRRVCVRNNTGKLTNYMYGERDPSMTVRHRFWLFLHHRQRHLPSFEMASTREHLIHFSFHDFTPMSAAFVGLGSTPLTYRELFRSKSYMKWTSAWPLCSMIQQTPYFNECHAFLYPASSQRRTPVILSSPVPSDSAHIAHFGPRQQNAKPVSRRKSVRSQSLSCGSA